ncbi:DUF1080 domain-containing protein [Ktedonosporobacter rubrisoli]|uniref:non-specific serine/threonine protein kinase n=1 Tax=Ktedonosporobacter rubrisoli TaxID=2509675 RepID=A0A4P6JV22_KTERU|nr:protein kinase [Ktedonosporobacter rubrisoli]QBD79203.1 DUF1080 domain-containing protein [Ktedonosporobacter rubrisoli]
MSLEGLKLGHYRLCQLIGSGSMGEVYLAEDLYVKRQVAIKIIRLEHVSDEQEATRLFQREIRAISQLDHPHILPLFDSGEEVIQNRRLAYMVMPYRAEGSLLNWLRRQRKKQLAPHIVAHIVEQAATALQHAHERQIIHQDVKPSNFLMRQRSEHPEYPDILLADFSIARFESASAVNSWQIRGTPAYMPPEQWRRQSAPASDQYALASSAYHLLIGHPPFSGQMEQVMHQHFTAQPQPPSTLNPQVSHALDAVILRALAKNPEERFPSVLQFAQAFQQAKKAPGDIHISLSISGEEARAGVIRTVTLPGRRKIVATIPPNSYNGKQIYLAEQGEPYYDGGPRSPVVLTLVVNKNATAGSAFPLDTNSHSLPELITKKVSSTPQLPPSPSREPAQPFAPPSSGSMSAMGKAASEPSPNKRPSPTPRPRRLLIIVAALGLLLILTSGATGLFLYKNHAQRILAMATASTLQASATAVRERNIAIAATATVTAGNHYPSYMHGSGKLEIYEPLNNHINSLWPESNTCGFFQDGYHIQEDNINHYHDCISASTYTDFTFEVQMKILKGDCGGFDIRNNGLDKAYLFEVCAGGTYTLIFYPDKTGNNIKVLVQGISPLINKGVGALNTVAIVAKGPDMTLFANGNVLASTQDSSSKEGHIGLAASEGSAPTEVAFQNARIWTF